MEHIIRQGETVYAELKKDTPLVDIITHFGVLRSDRFRTIAEKKNTYIIEILPDVDLGIRIIKWWK